MLRKLQPRRHSLGHTCVMGQVVAHGAGVAPHIRGSDRGHGSMFWRSSQGSQSQPSPGPSFQNSISKPRRNRALQPLTAFGWFDVTVPIPGRVPGHVISASTLSSNCDTLFKCMGMQTLNTFKWLFLIALLGKKILLRLTQNPK